MVFTLCAGSAGDFNRISILQEWEQLQQFCHRDDLLNVDHSHFHCHTFIWGNKPWMRRGTI
jgi:hypothetical protein